MSSEPLGILTSSLHATVQTAHAKSAQKFGRMLKFLPFESRRAGAEFSTTRV